MKLITILKVNDLNTKCNTFKCNKVNRSNELLNYFFPREDTHIYYVQLIHLYFKCAPMYLKDHIL